MKVAVHLDLFEDRHVVDRWNGQQHRCLVLVEHLERAGRGGAVLPHPRGVTAPRFGPLLRVGEIREFLTGPVVSTYILNCTLDPRFGRRRQLHPISTIGTDVCG
jgi:hypothetical protein